jgi:hypothetical protein
MGEMFKIQDFGSILDRYQALPLAGRARVMLDDGRYALDVAEKIVKEVAEHDAVKTLFDRLRKNAMLLGRMRPSEAKNALQDHGSDFPAVTIQKLAAWAKTAERLSEGEGIVTGKGGEYIPGNQPVAAAIMSMCSLGGYLSVIQLALDELCRMEPEKKMHYQSNIVKIRRCATMLADCEHASAVGLAVH